MVTKTKQYQIRRGKIEIDVPHNEKIITFVYEQYGPGTYVDVGNSIEKSELIKPIMAETASLVHQAHEAENEPEFNNIKNLMKNKSLHYSSRIPKFLNLGGIEVLH